MSSAAGLGTEEAQRRNCRFSSSKASRAGGDHDEQGWRKAEARRNILIGMVLGGVSADGIWDLLTLNPIFHKFEYFAFIGVIGTAVVMPTAVALVEEGRLTRQRGQSEAAR